MNYKVVFNQIGRIILTEAVLLLIPALLGLYFSETVAMHAFWIAAAVAALVGSVLTLFSRTKDRDIYAGEGFVIVAFVWIIMSLIGCLPFYLSGEIPSFVNAFFETVSGFTTTGASILSDVESLSNCLLFWRSFTHWIGGMGVLVFVTAIIPNSSRGFMNVMRAEMPGPIIGKLVPRIKDTAKILYLIYIVLTIVEIILLCAGDMPFFESVLHSLGTAGTGGFGVRNDSLAGYSPYSQWVITIFMLLFGINFNLYYLILIRRLRSVFQSTELWAYLGIAVTSSLVIACNILSTCNDFAEALRYSAFQVSSIITTTGYTTIDYNQWPNLSKGILLILMFVGGCAGSTAGGIKVSRVLLMCKLIRRELKRMLHPRSVNKVQFEGRSIDETTLNSVSMYFVLYLVCFVIISMLLSFENFSFETNFTAVAACFNNVGPGFDGVGPTSNFSAYSDFSTWVLSFAMLLGRLEIFPLIIALSHSTWTRKYR